MVLVNGGDPQRLAEHLTRVSAPCGLGIVPQDHPTSTGITITLGALAQAVQVSGVVVAVKAKAPPPAPTVAALTKEVDVPVFGGLGGVGLLDELLAGSSGAMTGFTVPEALVATVDAWRRGIITEAHVHTPGLAMPAALHPALDARLSAVPLPCVE